uniref:39S ribosomal protein L40, mitochondrial n=1 Tax=Rhabditophanes sp. KR3021 TaxID=114890 RepID=A0AC35U138_9BILA
MNSIGRIFQFSAECRGLHTSTALAGSVFMKRQKRMDPEVAKQRETRRRKKLIREIRQLQKHSKKAKPVEEMTIDVKSAKNIHERYRNTEEVSKKQLLEELAVHKQYNSHQNMLWKGDNDFLRNSLLSQDKALAALKKVSPSLYAEAIRINDSEIKCVFEGPPIRAPITGYEAPDGDFIDITRSWS